MRDYQTGRQKKVQGQLFVQVQGGGERRGKGAAHFCKKKEEENEKSGEGRCYNVEGRGHERWDCEITPTRYQ